MKKDNVLILLLSLIGLTIGGCSQPWEIEKKRGGVEKNQQQKSSPFNQELKAILSDHKNNKNELKKLIKELYDKQVELKEDLAKDGTFTKQELTLLFQIAKELRLPIVVAESNFGICEFTQ